MSLAAALTICNYERRINHDEQTICEAVTGQLCKTEKRGRNLVNIIYNNISLKITLETNAHARTLYSMRYDNFYMPSLYQMCENTVVVAEWVMYLFIYWTAATAATAIARTIHEFSCSFLLCSVIHLNVQSTPVSIVYFFVQHSIQFQSHTHTPTLAMCRSVFRSISHGMEFKLFFPIRTFISFNFDA